MDRKIAWTEKASSDIAAILRYLARRDPSAAARIGLGIYERAQILLEHPEAGTILDELRDGGWRKLIFRRWEKLPGIGPRMAERIIAHRPYKSVEEIGKVPGIGKKTVEKLAPLVRVSTP